MLKLVPPVKLVEQPVNGTSRASVLDLLPPVKLVEQIIYSLCSSCAVLPLANQLTYHLGQLAEHSTWHWIPTFENQKVNDTQQN